MPHQGVDTLYVSSTGCYTILDPGGTGKYSNNEDSYLYIIADENFWLDVDYETGHIDDGKDWIRIYYDTVQWYSHEYFCGTGQREMQLWYNRALIHFHSNNYNSFDGFTITLRRYSSIYNHSFSSPSSSSVTLSWHDSRTDASSWQVFYSCQDGQLDSITSNSTSVTISGIQPDRYYRYYIKNNVAPCTHIDYNWFLSRSDSSLVIMRPNGWNSDTIDAPNCLSLTGPTGDTAAINLDYNSNEFYFNNGHGVYLRGNYRTLSGEASTELLAVWGGHRGKYHYNWDGNNQRPLYEWYPLGYVRTIINGRSRFHYDILPENDSYIVPSVSALTATSATVSWTDATTSTSWTFRYCSQEGQWSQLSTTTPSVTLNGLAPGRQYLYTIEGNVKRSACDVPARHAFITVASSSDTIIMPYRGNKTVSLQPRHCYIVTDAGASGPYFSTDYSRLVLRTANGNGFRIKGSCSLTDDDILYLKDGDRYASFSNSSYDIQFSTSTDSLEVFFQSNAQSVGTGFVLQVLQVDDSILAPVVSNVTANSATISWNSIGSTSSYVVHYGDSEDNFHTVTSSSTSTTLSGLTPGTQYVYYVTDAADNNSCLFSNRHAFITLGLPSGDVLMPYRGVDTLIIQPNGCYRIWDAGGKQHNYFNNDTSVLVLRSSDNSDFTIDGQFLFGGNESLYESNSYENYDQINIQIYENQSDYWWNYDGWYNRFGANEHIRQTSSNGYMRIRFVSNGHTVRQGFCFTVDRSNGEVERVRITRVTRNSATVTWNDNSGASQWTVAYGTVGGTMYTATTNVRNYTMNYLQPNTDYEVRIYSGSLSQCDVPATFFTTLDNNSIVMPYNGDDTVYLTPGQCYYVYDPGGSGNYLPSDTSRLVIRSTTGEGFYFSASASVGATDYSDRLYVSHSGWGHTHFWWGWEQWQPANEDLTIELTTNEAIQDRGFWLWIRFPSACYNPDTINLTDSTVTITWMDTSAATQWNFSYGTNIDSMTTVTTSTKQFTMTGLQRNRQYFYSIYNTTENKECLLDNIYGVTMPCDAGRYVDPYRNHFLAYAGRQSLYFVPHGTLTPDNCYHFTDVGGIGNLFYQHDNSFHFHTYNDLGLTIEGYYDLGSSGIWIYTSQSSSWYSNSGYLQLYAPDGYVAFQHRVGNNPTDYATGFDFAVSFNYKIYNVHTQNVTCNSATLLWNDSTSATQWTLAYGPTEKQLDTLLLSSKSVNLTNLLPDHQYVCYLASNDPSLSCYKPVKYCFITTCDTTKFVLPYNKDTIRYLDIDECYTIYDGGGPLDYIYADHHNVWLRTPPGITLTLRGNIGMGDNDYLYAHDCNGNWIGGWSNATDIVIRDTNGCIMLEYNSAGDTITGSGFEFQVSFSSISNINVSLKTDTTCRLTWTDNSNASRWVCYYGMDRDNMDSVVTNNPIAHLSNLVYGKQYDVFILNNSINCMDTTWFSFCAGGDKCIEFGDLYSCFTTAYYGRIHNPEENRGIVDYGPDDINSRHTVIDDTLATDPRTGNQLRCVPQGYPHAIRLGNWDIGGEAESVSYEYDIDTTKSEVIILRYAAVLENPGHSPDAQPRFRFALYDEHNNEIDPDCYSADFVSGNNLGWNTYSYDTNTVLWKDWTAIGIDLAPLHGRHVYFKLTTYDCNEMGHFGYAYFTLECQQKEMRPSDCGVVHSNTFTAPEGFAYKWYNVDSADVTLSSQRTFTSNQNGIYKCRASFLGSTSSNCWFEKTAVVGDIFPYANFDYQIVDTVGCNVVVQFYNRSCVTLDQDNQQPTSMECDGFVWNFGDGTTSYEKHPMHIFPSDVFDVSLSASLNGQCFDDTTRTLLMYSPCIAFDTLFPVVCQGDTFALRDSVMTLQGDYEVRTEYHADSIVTTFVHLTVHHTLDTNILGGICDGNSYTLFGFNEDIEGDYVHAFTSVHGCDSIYRLHLEVATSYDTVVTRHGCTSSGFHYRDTTFYTSTIYTDSLLSIYSCDSVVTMNITITPSYYNEHFDTICEGDTFYFPDYPYPLTYSTTVRFITTTAAGCDSIDVFNLQVKPSYSTFDTAYICLNEKYFYRGQPYTPQLIVDSLSSIDLCDSVVHIDLKYYDSTFAARPFFSVDTLSWLSLDSNAVAGCLPLRVFFSDSAAAPPAIPDHIWYFGHHNATEAAYPSTSYLYTDTGIFDVVHVVRSADGCLDTARGRVQVLPLPSPDFIWPSDLITTINPTVHFVNLSQPADDSLAFLWYFFQHHDVETESPVDSSTLRNPDYTWLSDGEDLDGDHDVWLIASQSFLAIDSNTLFCVDTARKVVNIVNVLLQFPNAVTPNGDGINDTWNIVNIEYGRYPTNRIRIYDRWGRLVFKRDNVIDNSQPWDPNDCDCPDGTYFFRFDAIGEPGSVQHNGAIEVIR